MKEVPPHLEGERGKTKETTRGPGLFLDATHAQLHATTQGVDFEDAHLHDLADGYDAERIFDEAVGEFGDVDEAVLLDADIDEGSEVDDVAHGALQDHLRLQILDFEHVVTQNGSRQGVARVEAGFLQIFQDIVQSGKANANFFCEIRHRSLFGGGIIDGTIAI